MKEISRMCPVLIFIVLLAHTVSAGGAETPGTMKPPEKLRLAETVESRYGKPRQGIPGKPVDGLTLAAASAADPEAGQCVTLWLTLKNVSEIPVYIYQHFWGLYIQPQHMTEIKHPRCVSCTLGVAPHLMDFVVLQPGQSIVYLMDADPIPGARSSGTYNAYLDIPTPRSARKLLEGSPGMIFGSSGLEAVSGPITIQYRNRQPVQDQHALVLINAFHRKEPGAEKNLADAFFAVQEVVKNELRSPEEVRRWSMFQFVCRHPRPDMAEEAVDFFARWGPRSRDGKLLDAFSGGNEPPRLIYLSIRQLIQSFAPSLGIKQRLEFFSQTGLALPYDFREVGDAVGPLTVSGDPRIQACAARVFILFCERGETRPNVWEYVANQKFGNTDPGIYDPAGAELYARRAVELSGGKAIHRFMLHTIRGEFSKQKKLAAKCNDPNLLNRFAWMLSNLPNLGKDQADLAVECAEKAVKLTKPPEQFMVLDTLAAAYSAQKSYAKAISTQQKALRRLPGNILHREDYFKRLILYMVQSEVPPQQRPRLLSEIKGVPARDILIRLLENTPKGAELRANLIHVLKDRYPNDPAAVRAIGGKPSVKPRIETKPEDQEIF